MRRKTWAKTKQLCFIWLRVCQLCDFQIIFVRFVFAKCIFCTVVFADVVFKKTCVRKTYFSLRLSAKHLFTACLFFCMWLCKYIKGQGYVFSFSNAFSIAPSNSVAFSAHVSLQHAFGIFQIKLCVLHFLPGLAIQRAYWNWTATCFQPRPIRFKKLLVFVISFKTVDYMNRWRQRWSSFLILWSLWNWNLKRCDIIRHATIQKFVTIVLVG